MMSSKEIDIVEWKAFYSERAQREYYFNAKTNIVTWILPDELHPANQPEDEMKLVGTTDRRIPTQHCTVERNTDEKPRRWRKLALPTRSLTLLLLGLSATANFLLWRSQQQGAEERVLDNVKHSDWCSEGEGTAECLSNYSASPSGREKEEALHVDSVERSRPSRQTKEFVVDHAECSSEQINKAETQKHVPMAPRVSIQKRQFDPRDDAIVAVDKSQSVRVFSPFLHSFASQLLRLLKKLIPKRKKKKADTKRHATTEQAGSVG